MPKTKPAKALASAHRKKQKVLKNQQIAKKLHEKLQKYVVKGRKTKS